MEFKYIIKKIEGTLSEEEALLFESWISASIDHQNYFEKVRQQYNAPPLTVDAQKGWNIIAARLELKKIQFNYYKVGFAASIIGLLFYVVIDQQLFFNEQVLFTENTIQTHTNKAILKSETGAEYVLEKGKEIITKNAVGNGDKLVYSNKEKPVEKEVFNYLKVPRGGQFYVELADGTKVWLNADSELKYPVRFRKNKPREVELLYGEAYFDVSPSELHKGAPFVLTTKKQKVEVLGTQFNVKAYKDESFIYTTLIEGSVDVSANGNSTKNIPKQQTIFNQDLRVFEVKTVDVLEHVSWKKGVFNFNKVSLKEIMKVIARWYDFEVVFENPEIENIKYIGSLNRKQRIEDILNDIQKTGTITNFKIIDKTILLY